MNEMKPIFKRWLLPNYTSVKRFAFWKVSVKITLGFPFIRGFSSHEWNDTHPLMMTASQVYECAKVSVSEKLVLKYATLGFSFIKGFPSQERNKTHPLMMTGSQVYECVKVSPSEKWVLNNATWGFPFIWGFPSHEWNDTHSLSMAAYQVY